MAVFYALLGSIGSQIPWAQKFTQRGWTPYAAVFLSFWSLSILVGKLISVSRRNKCLKGTFIPNNPQLDTDEGIQQSIKAAYDTSRRLKDTIIGPRIQRALEHFLASRNIKEVSDILGEESDADFAELESSYAWVRVFLWAIPILGFIGTVIGVGDAIGGFAKFLSGAQEMDQIKNALTGVTSGLSVAFDTTFVALLLSMVVMMVMSAVEKTERDQLQAVEDYCQNHVLRRLPARATTQGNGPIEIVPNLGEIFREILSQVVQVWIGASRQLTQNLADSLSKAWEEAGRQWSEGLQRFQEAADQNYAEQQATLEKMGEERKVLQTEAANLLSKMKGLLESEQDNLRKVLETEQRAVTEAVQKQHNQVQQYVGAFLRHSGKLEELIELQNRLENDLLRAAGSDGLPAVLKDVRNTLQTLDPALHRLADKPIDVEVHFVAGPPAVTGR